MNISIVLIALAVLPLLLFYFDRMPRVLIETNNEGWNAFLADRIFQGDLYPGDGALIINNYPPLGFWVHGAFGAITGDTVVSGRAVSIAAFFVIAYCIYRIVKRTSSDRQAAAFAAVLFGGLFLCFPGGRLGLNDPQLLAHAVMALGLVLLCRDPDKFANLLAAALLMAAAGLTKHNIVAMPMAATLWLWLEHRKSFRTWLLCLALAGALAFALLLFAGGQTAISSILSPRFFDPGKAVADARRWILLTQAPLMVWLWMLFTGPQSPDRTLANCLVASALLEVALFAGGIGVVANVAFDLVIAACIAVGIGMAQARSGTMRGLVAVAMLVQVGLHLPSTGVKFLATRGAEKANEERLLVSDLARMRQFKPPYLCLDMVVCYYAKEPFYFDPFNMGQMFRLQRRSAAPLIERINAAAFSVIEMSAEVQMGLEEVHEAIMGRYQLAWETADRKFLTPK